MAAIRNILNVYEKADSAKKVDIIIRYYPNFLGIVDSYTEGLRYMIENEKAYNRSKNRGDLGVPGYRHPESIVILRQIQRLAM